VPHYFDIFIFIVIIFSTMQLVILAAGRGKRMNALTENMPKPMLSVLGQNLIERKLQVLPTTIDEIIIVIGYLGDQIKSHFGDSWKGIPVRYVIQKENTGTGKAVWEAKPFLRANFMVMMGDDLYSKEDVEQCASNGWAVLVEKVDRSKTGAKVLLDAKGNLETILEGSPLESGMLNNAGLYVLGTEFFNYPLVKKDPTSEEYGLPQTLIAASKDFKVRVVESKNWHQITSPEDLERVAKLIK
jgi:NDP-sugar pyrophosphorylase family protein